MSVYGATRVVFRFLLYGLYRMKVQGRENMPEGGSFIILSNHRSMIDPFVLGTLYEGGELVLDFVKPKSHCLDCGAEFEHDRFHLLCPECGSRLTMVTEGKELHIASIEVDVPDEE